MLKNIVNKLLNRPSFQTGNYWENRYTLGGNSGDGSYGRLAEFKSEIINGFLNQHQISSAIDLGCGDGNQLSLIQYNKFIGLDISPSAINQCKQKYKDDPTREFFVYQPGIANINPGLNADLSLSLDVIYHLVEKKVYTQYLKDLFGLATHFVIIYSTNFDQHQGDHIIHRRFTDDVETLFPQWQLISEIKNIYPGTAGQESLADFFIFEKKLN